MGWKREGEGGVRKGLGGRRTFLHSWFCTLRYHFVLVFHSCAPKIYQHHLGFILNIIIITQIICAAIVSWGTDLFWPMTLSSSPVSLWVPSVSKALMVCLYDLRLSRFKTLQVYLTLWHYLPRSSNCPFQNLFWHSGSLKGVGNVLI